MSVFYGKCCASQGGSVPSHNHISYNNGQPVTWPQTMSLQSMQQICGILWNTMWFHYDMVKVSKRLTTDTHSLPVRASYGCLLWVFWDVFCGISWNTMWCHYDMVKVSKRLTTDTHSLPSQASCGMSFVGYGLCSTSFTALQHLIVIIDCIITKADCI